MEYKKTTWIDHKTPVDAKRLNNIENAIDTLSKLSVTPGRLKTINGKSLVGSGNLSLSDLGDIDEESIKEGLGYTPASVDEVPIWETVEEDGSTTKDIPDIRLGQGLITTNGEAAVGRYNLSVPGNVLEVGSGTSSDDRRNSIEVKETGEVYIYGIGGYNGKNSDDPNVMPIAGYPSPSGGEESPTPTTSYNSIWVGTMEEYDALTWIDPGKIYYIKKS